ncbi:MAG: InlB B-repeat-containing protein [Bacteroidales bacterium]|nr:InlB B-repeat-containing protein [Bacteroidales bacterium]
MSGCNKKETYTVTFDANGGTGTMEAQTFTEGEAQALTRNAFTYDGYTFSDWNTVQSGSGASYTDGQTITVTADLTLYAQWKSNTAIVTFNANGGSGEMAPQTFTIGTPQVLSANSFTWENHEFIGWNISANGTEMSCFDVQEITIYEDVTLYAQWMTITGQHGGHCYVDLGLPSGTKWATCNVGANSPIAYGVYFAWGETSPKSNYTWGTYHWCNGSESTLTKYCDKSSYGNNGFTDNLTTLEAADDAATVNWGEGWRMPTKAEMNELLNSCTHTYIKRNGMNGRLFTGPNGNSIFIPSAGTYNGSTNYGANSYGEYWLSNIVDMSPSFANDLYFERGNYDIQGLSRSEGKPVRPVLIENN